MDKPACVDHPSLHSSAGDYLASYCGLHHVDGDEDMRKSDPARKSATQCLVKAFSEHWFRNQNAPVELWHPYHEMLCARCLDAVEKHGQIVVSFSVYRREAREFLRTRLAASGLQFLKLECNLDVVVKAAIERLETYLELNGKTIDEHWNGPSMFPGVCFRDRYGEYSYENFRKMQLDFFLAGMEEFNPEEPEDYTVVDVSSRDQSAFDRISEALALPSNQSPVDVEMLGEIQKSRWKAM
eukprot:SAG31_NODE_5199_length_2681_cov_4.603408_3_plen_240_part_00